MNSERNAVVNDVKTLKTYPAWPPPPHKLLVAESVDQCLIVLTIDGVLRVLALVICVSTILR